MNSDSIKLGIIGLGRWARVLTRAAKKSRKLEIVAGYSRSEEKRDAFQAETGIRGVPDMETLLADPEIKGVILTVPNEQHLPVAEAVAKAGKEHAIQQEGAAPRCGQRARRRRRLAPRRQAKRR